MKILQVCPPHLSDVATLPWDIQKIIFNCIIHTYFWLFMLSQKKTNCNPLAHPAWKCHNTNLWIAKFFRLIEGLLCSFKRWRLWREQVVGCHRWLWKQEAQPSPSDHAMRLVSSNLANYHATVQKLLIRQVLTKLMVWSWRFSWRQCVMNNVHSTMTRPSRLPLSQVS